MKRVLTAVVLIPLVLLAVFRAPMWLFVLLVGIIIVLALDEYLDIAEAAGIKPFRWLTYAIALVPIVVAWCSNYIAHQITTSSSPFYYRMLAVSRILLVLPILAPVIFGIALVFRKDLRAGLAAAAASAFGFLYISGSLSQLILLRADFADSVLVIFVLFSVWAGDIAAYYAGRSIGKHKLAPIVSPNKSWEGAIASVIASVAVAFVVFHFKGTLNGYFVHGDLPSSDYWNCFFHSDLLPKSVLPIHVIIIGILTNLAAQFGDLFESALKRGANLKDSGTLLPGHGGVLDRIDALLFAIPVVWYYANLTGFLHP
jgi:phosphatidate cytidylyltransferase